MKKSPKGGRGIQDAACFRRWISRRGHFEKHAEYRINVIYFAREIRFNFFASEHGKASGYFWVISAGKDTGERSMDVSKIIVAETKAIRNWNICIQKFVFFCPLKGPTLWGIVHRIPQVVNLCYQTKTSRESLRIPKHLKPQKVFINLHELAAVHFSLVSHPSTFFPIPRFFPMLIQCVH